jgi:hypothetical protein
MTFPFRRGRVINEDTIVSCDTTSVVIIEMVKSNPMQLLGSRIGCLAPVDARSTFEEKSPIYEHSSQCQATVPQKRKAPGFGKL